MVRTIEVVDHEDGSLTLEHRIDNDLAGQKEITADEVDAIIDKLGLPVRAALRSDSPEPFGGSAPISRESIRAASFASAVSVICDRYGIDEAELDRRLARPASTGGDREGKEAVEVEAWLTYRGPGQGIYIREYEAGGRTWYRDGEGMKLLPGESIKVRIRIPRQHGGNMSAPETIYVIGPEGEGWTTDFPSDGECVAYKRADEWDSLWRVIAFLRSCVKSGEIPTDEAIDEAARWSDGSRAFAARRPPTDREPNDGA